MPLFRHHHDASGPDRPASGSTNSGNPGGTSGPASFAAAQGWQPVAGPPFHHHAVDGIHDITRAMYGAPRQTDTTQRTVGDTTFSDAFRVSAGGRTVIAANAHTYIDPALFQAGHLHPDVAVCAVELACPVTLLSVQPRQFPAILALPETRAGRPDFDDRFLVQATADMPRPLQRILTAEAQQQMLARDDWFFRAGRGLLGCVGTEPFRSVDEVSQRISAVLAIAAVMPAALVMSAPVTPPPAPAAPGPDGYPPPDHHAGPDFSAGPDGQAGPDRYSPDEYRFNGVSISGSTSAKWTISSWGLSTRGSFGTSPEGLTVVSS